MLIGYWSRIKVIGLMVGLIALLRGLEPMGMGRGAVQALDKPGVHSIPDLPTLWRNTDAVVYLRVGERAETRPMTAANRIADGAIECQAAVIEVFRRYRGEPSGTTIHFLPGPAGRALPFRPGEELIAFFSWNESALSLEANVIVRVREEGVRSSEIEELLPGRKLEEFLKMLRAMME